MKRGEFDGGKDGERKGWFDMQERETEAMIGERGPLWGAEWIYLLLRWRVVCDGVSVCVRMCVCVKLTQRPTRLYCCLSLQQKLSGADRLAASLISALFPSPRVPLPPPPSPSLPLLDSARSLRICHRWIPTNGIYSLGDRYNAHTDKGATLSFSTPPFERCRDNYQVSSFERPDICI